MAHVAHPAAEGRPAAATRWSVSAGRGDDHLARCRRLARLGSESQRSASGRRGPICDSAWQVGNASSVAAVTAWRGLVMTRPRRAVHPPDAPDCHLRSADGELLDPAGHRREPVETGAPTRVSPGALGLPDGDLGEDRRHRAGQRGHCGRDGDDDDDDDDGRVGGGGDQHGALSLRPIASVNHHLRWLSGNQTARAPPLVGPPLVAGASRIRRHGIRSNILV